MILKKPFGELISSVIGGGWGKDKEFADSTPVAVIRGADFPNARIGDFSSIPQRWEGSKKSAKRLLEAGDIILEVAGGTTDRPTGRTLYISEGFLQKIPSKYVIPASFCKRLRVNSTLVNPHYLYWYLQHIYRLGRMWDYQVRSTGIANFQYNWLAEDEIVPLPSLEVQQGIAATLGALDDKIESNRHLVTVSNAFLKCEFDKICQESTPVYFNFDQTIKRLQVKHKQSGKTVSLTGRTPVFDQSISGILGYVSTDPEFDASASDPIILFGDHTCSLRLLKQAADVGPNVIPMISTDFKGISTVWIYFALLGKQKMQEYRRHWMEFREKEIIWVDEVAQRNFLSIATPILEKTISAEKENKKLQSLRDALMPELMSGRIRVPEAREVVQEATDTELPKGEND